MTPMDGTNVKGDARLARDILNAEQVIDPRDDDQPRRTWDATAAKCPSLVIPTCPACGSARPTNGRVDTTPKAADADGWDYFANRAFPSMLWRYRPGQEIGEAWATTDPKWTKCVSTRRSHIDGENFGPATRTACEAFLGWTKPEPVKAEQTLAEARASGFIDPSRLCGKCGGHGAVGKVLCDCRAGRKRFAAINPPDRAADIIRDLTELKDSLAQARVMCDHGLAQIEAYKRQWGIK